MLARLSLALALLALPAVAARAQTAPLPPHWSHAHHDEDEEDYRLPAPLRGIAGHGFSGVSPLEGSNVVCKGNEAEQARILALAENDTEFWFYATAHQAVLFRRTLSVDTEKPCGQALSWTSDISRAFVADGLVQSFSVDAEGRLEVVAGRPIRDSDGLYSGAFNPIHNLLARTGLPSGKRTSSQRIAGIPARCGGMSGLVWHSSCIASTGPLRGMLLKTEGGDDERMMFYLAFDRIDPNARLDGRLFELEREWTEKE